MERELQKKVKLIAFMAMIDGSSKCFSSKSFKNYKAKVKHVSKKIDKWWRKHSKANTGSFEKDEEYRMEVASPKEFSPSRSSDEENSEAVVGKTILCSPCSPDKPVNFDDVRRVKTMVYPSTSAVGSNKKVSEPNVHAYKPVSQQDMMKARAGRGFKKAVTSEENTSSNNLRFL